MSREARCTYGGKVYIIPEIWLAGIMQSHPGITLLEAIAFWAEQADLAALEDQARPASDQPNGCALGGADHKTSISRR